MTSIRKNIFANLSGNAAVALLSFVFIPVYVHALGIEAFGLIGFFASIQAVLSLLDFGVSAALTRELARISTDQTDRDTAHQIVRTTEILYWFTGILLGIVTAYVIAPLAVRWISFENLPREEASHALVLMGIAFAARWPFVLYSGALLGLDRQPLLNCLRVSAEAVRSAGAAAILLLVSPTLSAFLNWQIAANLAASVLAGLLTWKGLRRSTSRPAFSLLQLRRVYRYMLGMSGISITAAVLTQVDKFILSRIVSLEEFGYYMLAWAVANALSVFSAPVFSAFFPSLLRAAAIHDEDALRGLYHRGSQIMSGFLIPIGVTLSFFSKEALAVWTHNAALAERACLPLAVLAMGTVLHGLMYIPYALMLAFGWTSLPFYANLIAILGLIPLVSVLAYFWGPLGAAYGWVAVNACHIVFTQFVLHRRLLPLERMRWFVEDSLKPLLICLAIALTARIILGEMTTTEFLLSSAMTLAICFGACVWSLPHLRAGFVSLLQQYSVR